jgi:type II secretory pathway pseudopilin PulG
MIRERVSMASINLKQLGQEGFTLIEAMILATILSITIVTFSSWSFQRARLIHANELRKKNEQVANAIKTAAAQSESLTQTEELMFDTTLPMPSPSPF